jgi:chitinase
LQGDQWVGYDDPNSAAVKANYVVSNNLGGAMIWDLPSDDFRQPATYAL